jgi:hypothetical protein
VHLQALSGTLSALLVKGIVCSHPEQPGRELAVLSEFREVFVRTHKCFLRNIDRIVVAARDPSHNTVDH